MNRQVILTAGHSIEESGAVGYINESEETIVLRDLLARRLKVFHGIDVKTDLDTMSLNGVVSWIKKIINNTDIVIDIHFNALAKDKASGVEVLVSSDGEIERPMAEEICETTANVLGIKNRGVKGEAKGHHSKLAMLSNFQAEQMIYEVCFCDNKKDCQSYDVHKEELVRKLACVIAKYAKE